ncbi:BadF/BadG/BcrA/BcrD ATPase family protein [Streptomyces sp. NRRL F-5123]|uniref:BadF/BadG/BcrA/BcrD ATPase family protein n=1 Tax=Streptomyces sp. NRRL F-5123 TaxID=1463856 RepID=UPI0004E236E6|nr:BadF/BadG/BcrA/BcrD ATPase family protein [Streptomyces sp. NRRL F-5123]
MNEIYNRRLVVGIDAGGTRIRAALAAAEPGGALLGTGSGGPGNALSVGRAQLTAHLAAALAQAVPPAARARVGAVHGGFAGAAPGLGPERGHGLVLACLGDAFAALGMAPDAVEVGGDTEVALAAAPGAPRDGLVLIAGTGAVAARVTAGQRALVADGHGWLLGDEGSGFWLGAQAVRATLAALDGRGPATSLVPAVLAHYGVPAASGPGVRPEAAAGSPPAAASGESALGAGIAYGGPGRPAAGARDLTGPVGGAPGGPFAQAVAEGVVVRAYEAAPVELALLSPLVVAAAGEGDAVAAGLLARAAELLAAGVRALGPRAGEPLVLSGGLLGPGGPLVGRVSELLAGTGVRVFPVSDGVGGAVALARLLRS